MDFAALQMFKAVVDEGGITPAAKKLHRVQSNVTTRIQQLEDSLGTKLFVRSKRRLHLSPAGKLFLGYVEQLLDITEQARNALADGLPRGELRIGSLESIVASRLPPLLSGFHRKFPAVRIELSTGTNDDVIDAVRTRKIDAGFVAECPATAHLESLPAFNEELVVIAPRTHPAIRRAGDVQIDTIIAFPAGCAYRRRLQAWLAEDDIAPQKVLELASYHAIVACVASGTGIAIVPRSVLATLRATSEVAVYPLAGRKGMLTTAFVWRKGEAPLAVRAMQAEVLAHKKALGKARD
jgi:DNA-binding transcriptional LysR family regulator